MRIACSTVRRMRFLSASGADGWGHPVARSWPKGRETLALLLTARARLVLQRRALCFHLGDLGERLVPAPCSCARHQALVGIDAGIVPPGPLGLVARFCQGQVQRLPCGVMGGETALKRLQGRCDPGWVDGVQDGGCDGPVDAETAERQTRCGAASHTAAVAHLARHAPRRPALGPLELPATAPTTEHATAQGRTPRGGATDGGLWRVALGRQGLLVLHTRLPPERARMLIPHEETPRLARLLPTWALPGAPILAARLRLGAPSGERPSGAGMGQYVIAARPTGPAPEERTACGAGLPRGPWQWRITRPPGRVASPPQDATRPEAPRHGGLDLAVGALCKAMVVRPHNPDGDFPHALAAPDVLFEGWPRPLTPHAPRLFRDRALHAAHEASVALARIREAIIIPQPGVG
jgi:hypothetical protein